MSLVVVQETMDPTDIFYDAEEQEEDDQIEDLISPISYKSSSSSVSTNETESYVKAVVLDLVKKYCMKSPVFANAKTDQDILDILKYLETWRPCEYMRENFPVYYTGQSLDGSPVWIVQVGKFDLKALASQGPDTVNEIDNIVIQTAQMWVKSGTFINKKSPEFRPVLPIIDFDGFQFNRFATPAGMSILFTYARRYKNLGESIMGKKIAINVFPAAEYILNTLKAVVVGALKKVKVYGRDEQVWRERLLKTYPIHALPPNYGGTLQDQLLPMLQYIHLYSQVTFKTTVTTSTFKSAPESQ